MFIGHFGAGFAGKRIAPSVSLGTLFLSVQLADLLWPLLLLLGLEHVRVERGITKLVPMDFYDYPWSHSLLMLALWALVFAGVHRVRKRNSVAAVLLVAGVLSHWVLDFLVHRPDMPVLPRGPMLGLGLWNSPPAAVALEAGLYAAGIGLYLSVTRARDRTGVWSLWTLVGLLFAIWIVGLLGPPPPGATAIALSGIAMWLTVPWGYWIDRHRQPTDPSAPRHRARGSPPPRVPPRRLRRSGLPRATRGPQPLPRAADPSINRDSREELP